MADYPTKLRNFKAWAKAMEEGATVDRPAWSKSGRTSVGPTVNRRARRKRRTFPRRKRKMKD